MSEHMDQLDKWFKERPKWLQDAARRLLENGGLAQTDLDELYKICGAEAGINFSDEEIPEYSPIQAGSFAQDEDSSRVELRSIANVKGVNALNPNKPITFGNGLTVIYGQNGSGKSGYTRLLKQICGAKNVSHIYPDVFDGAPESQVCDIDYMIDDKDQSVRWDIASGINEHLSSIELYDSDCGSVYVNEENELAYEPGLLRVFSGLIEMSDELSNRFDISLNGLVSAMPVLPANYVNTPSDNWLKGIKHNTNSASVGENCQWSEDEQKELDAITVRLNSPDPGAQSIKSRQSKVEVDKLVKGFRNWEHKLGAESCAAYLVKKKDSKTKIKAASEYAKSVFKQSPLSGVGEDVWSLMWEQARNYSTQKCYSEVEFPNVAEGSLCVLCQQPLGEEAKQRLADFENFVEGELDLAAKQSVEELSAIEKGISGTPDEELISTIAKAANLDSETLQLVLDLRVLIENRACELLKTEIDKVFEAGIDFSLIIKLEETSAALENLAKQMEEDAKKDNRQELDTQKNQLEAKKWLFEQKQSILSEIELLKEIKKLKAAKTLVNTVALSKKKSNLAEELVSEEYLSRFASEVEYLGAERISVKLEKTRAPKGRVYFKLKLDGCEEGIPVGHVLSEGEFRIISLAAFLADVEGRSEKSTFLFDDPISSLDQEYEEKVSARLVGLSKTRQVVVFTHRLSLLASLEEEAKKQEVSHNVVGLYKEHWGTGQPGLPPMHSQKTKNAINTLISKIPEGRAIYEKQGAEPYSWWAKSVCSNTRITIERVVECDLLADVVQRFRRPINTQGKLVNVAKVSTGDCSYIDGLMTKFSKYEHAQPSEAPVIMPLPDALEADLITLRDWREEFVKREI
jgi:DNA repair ATPase RecN